VFCPELLLPLKNCVRPVSASDCFPLPLSVCPAKHPRTSLTPFLSYLASNASFILRYPVRSVTVEYIIPPLSCVFGSLLATVGRCSIYTFLGLGRYTKTQSERWKLIDIKCQLNRHIEQRSGGCFMCALSPLDSPSGLGDSSLPHRWTVADVPRGLKSPGSSMAVPSRIQHSITVVLSWPSLEDRSVPQRSQPARSLRKARDNFSSVYQNRSPSSAGRVPRRTGQHQLNSPLPVLEGALSVPSISQPNNRQQVIQPLTITAQPPWANHSSQTSFSPTPRKHMLACLSDCQPAPLTFHQQARPGSITPRHTTPLQRRQLVRRATDPLWHGENLHRSLFTWVRT
jgi:hypothetical protein